MHWPHIHLPPSVQPLEIVWAIIGVIGIAHSIPLALRFYHALGILKRDNLNGGDEILAWGWLGAALFGVGEQTAILFAGAAAMLAIPAVPNAPNVSPTLIIITVALLVFALLSGARSWWLLYSSNKIADYLRRKVGRPYITTALQGHEEEA